MKRDNPEDSLKILEAIQKIIQTVALASVETKKQIGISMSLANCLRELAQDGPLSFRELGRRIGLTPSAITNVIDRLENRKLVSRNRSTTDRRVILAEITKAGTKTLQRLPKSPHEKLREGLESLSTLDKTQINKRLSQVIALMGAKDLELVDAVDIEVAKLQ